MRYYAIRLAKGAATSALAIWRGFPTDPDTGEVLTERPCLWRAKVNGEDVDAYDCASVFWTDAPEPFVKGTMIDEIEYERILRTRAWAIEHAPHAPEANPRQAVDLFKAPLPF